MRSLWIPGLVVGILTSVTVAGAHEFWPPVVERGRYLMGTLCVASAESADTMLAGAALDRTLDEIARLDTVMSSWQTDGELARFHAAAHDGFVCSLDLYAALSAARAWAESTGGAFDPTIEPVNRAWDTRGPGRVPNDGDREAARTLVSWRDLELDAATGRARLTRPGMGIDLGGIGKGVALDRAAEALRSNSIVRARVNFGGEILAIGAWEIAVADPRDRLRPAFRLELKDAALSTSAQSERGFVTGHQRYGHILDPRTAAPVPFTGSVSVLASSATAADALSTALLVLGRSEAERFARLHPAFGVLWLEPAGKRLRAWKWNLDTIEAIADMRVAWMN